MRLPTAARLGAGEGPRAGGQGGHGISGWKPFSGCFWVGLSLWAPGASHPDKASKGLVMQDPHRLGHLQSRRGIEGLVPRL